MQTALAAVGLPPALATIPPFQAAPSPVAEARSGFRRTVSAEEEIFTEGDRAGTFYKVVSGVVRTCKLLSDGRRQIDAFHLPGDIFGWRRARSIESMPRPSPKRGWRSIVVSPVPWRATTARWRGRSSPR